MRFGMRFAVAVAAFCGANTIQAQFFDQGMINTPVVRTDYSDPNYGTSISPVVLGTCLFPGNHHCTATQPLIYSQSNFWVQNWPSGCAYNGSCGRYWAVISNNEPAEVTNSSGSPLNQGPPDASLQLVAPGGGIMGFKTLYGNANFHGDTYWRAHLVLDINSPGSAPTHQPIPGGLPFLGFGTWTDPNGAGNGGPIAQIVPSSGTTPSVLKFGARLWQASLPQSINGGSQPGLLLAELHLIAEWGTHPKAINVLLYSNSTNPPYISTGSIVPYAWAWPYIKSGFYPGAYYVTINAQDFAGMCSGNPSIPVLALGADVNYAINLTNLFSCLNYRNAFDEPLPSSGVVKVTKVFWAVEGAGENGNIWIDVHGQKVISVSEGLGAIVAEQ